MQALPTPDSESQAHSDRCAGYLRELMGDGNLSFAEFMQASLYGPGVGYYTAGSRKFGRDGDFVTAPELSPVFSRVLARQVAGVLGQLDKPSILELGAGSGVMAVDLFEKLIELDAAPECYRILEVSPDLQQRQRQLVEARLPGHAHRFAWLSDMPEAMDGVILANEVLDALPVERFQVRDGELLQQRVGIRGDGFGWQPEAAPPVLRSAVRELESALGRRFEDGYRSEICLAAGGWVSSLVHCLGRGVAFLFDYGTDQRTYYAPDRDDGWLHCHFRHRAHSDPLLYPGIQDITAWVDFTRVAEAAHSAGAAIAGFVTQAHFLMSGGLDEELRFMQDAPLDQQLALSAGVKTLTLPGEMGEHVKCLGLSKGQVRVPEALTLMDITHTL